MNFCCPTFQQPNPLMGVNANTAATWNGCKYVCPVLNEHLVLCHLYIFLLYKYMFFLNLTSNQGWKLHVCFKIVCQLLYYGKQY